MSLIDREKTMEGIPIDVCDGFEVTDIIKKMPTVKAISLERIKEAREQIENLTPWDESTVEMYKVLEILNKLIEEGEKL